jgi:hypothetical protein
MRISDLRDQLIEVIKAILGGGSRRISGSESLTTDLGMDSLNLMQLFSLVDSEFGSVDLMPWLVSSAAGGHDTVDGFCRYIAAAIETAEPARRVA